MPYTANIRPQTFVSFVPRFGANRVGTGASDEICLAWADLFSLPRTGERDRTTSLPVPKIHLVGGKFQILCLRLMNLSLLCLSASYCEFPMCRLYSFSTVSRVSMSETVLSFRMRTMRGK